MLYPFFLGEQYSKQKNKLAVGVEYGGDDETASSCWLSGKDGDIFGFSVRGWQQKKARFTLSHRSSAAALRLVLWVAGCTALVLL